MQLKFQTVFFLLLLILFARADNSTNFSNFSNCTSINATFLNYSNDTGIISFFYDNQVFSLPIGGFTFTSYGSAILLISFITPPVNLTVLECFNFTNSSSLNGTGNNSSNSSNNSTNSSNDGGGSITGSGGGSGGTSNNTNSSTYNTTSNSINDNSTNHTIGDPNSCTPVLNADGSVSKDVIRFDTMPFQDTSSNWRWVLDSPNPNSAKYYRLVVSPDGKYVYVADSYTNSINIFSWDSSTEQLTLQAKYYGLDVPNVFSPISVAISPDGNNLYVSSTPSGTNHKVIVLSRSSVDGSLTWSSSSIALYWPDGLSVSPDGKFVYVAEEGNHQIVIFSRSSVDGSLTFSETYSGGNGVSFNNPDDVGVSPDGKYIYLVDEFNNNIIVLQRNLNFGSLTYSATFSGNGVNTFNNPEGISISADGRFVYVTDESNKRIVILSRNIGGSLTWYDTYSGDSNTHQLDFAYGISASPDGKYLFLTDFSSSIASRIVVLGISSSTVVRVRSESFKDAFKLTGPNFDSSNVYYAQEFYVHQPDATIVGLTLSSDEIYNPYGPYTHSDYTDNYFGIDKVGLELYDNTFAQYSINDMDARYIFKTTDFKNFNTPGVDSVWDSQFIEKFAPDNPTSVNGLEYVYGNEKTRCFRVKATPRTVDNTCLPEINLLNNEVVKDAIRFDVLDISSSSLRKWGLYPGPPPFPLRYGHTSFVLNGAMYVVGGFTYNGFSNDVYFSPDGISFNKIMPNPGFAGRWGFSSFVLNVNGVNTACIVGGITSTGLSNEVWCTINGANWFKQNVNPNNVFTPRTGQTTVVFNGIVYLIGGYDVTGSYMNDVWASNDGLNWMQQPIGAFTARTGHTSFVFNNKLYVIGGLDNTGLLNDVWSTPNGLNWIREPNAGFTPRKEMASFVYNGKVYVTTGVTATGPTYVSKELWSFDGINWVKVTDAPGYVERHLSTALVFNGKPYLIAGDTSNAYIGFSNDVYTPMDQGVIRVKSIGFNDAFHMSQKCSTPGPYCSINLKEFYIFSDGKAGTTIDDNDLEFTYGTYNKANTNGNIGMTTPESSLFSINDGSDHYSFQSGFSSFDVPGLDSVIDTNGGIQTAFHALNSQNQLEYLYGAAKTRCFKIKVS